MKYLQLLYTVDFVNIISDTLAEELGLDLVGGSMGPRRDGLCTLPEVLGRDDWERWL